jgi:hypothetical protein
MNNDEIKEMIKGHQTDLVEAANLANMICKELTRKEVTSRVALYAGALTFFRIHENLEIDFEDMIVLLCTIKKMKEAGAITDE